MDTTVGALKVGTQLVMGKYGVDKDSPHPIVWLKGNPNCDFITEKAIDYSASMRQKRLGIIGVLIMRSIQCPICFRS